MPVLRNKMNNCARIAAGVISITIRTVSQRYFIATILAFAASLLSARAFSGASVPWTTYEAEDMTISGGTILGPQYGPNVVASESSGRRCVQLNGTGQYVQFTASAAANSLVVRYSVPDTANGTGTNYTISLYLNGTLVAKLPVTSQYSWLYGDYPYLNNPASGSPRNFYDEVRTNGLVINPGDVVRVQKDGTDTAAYYVIDLVELENIAAPIPQPGNSLSIMSYGAGGTGATDDTTPLVNCIAAAISQNKSVWLPAGTYKITSSIDLPSNLTVQGAGMWHSTLVGDATLYTTSSRRVTLNGNGSNIHLSDFGITGKLNYRNDSEPNDGLGGSYGTGSTIARVWVEHTKTGAWIVNSQGLVVDSCRFRNTMADGINYCVGMQSSIITNCTARGTGDDAFAIWPATYTSQTYAPGLNVITHCTAQTPFLANGGAIYGGNGNRIEDCVFQDISYGCGILISTTFPIGANTFSGTTVAQRCELNRCGGYDPGYGWRAALQLCLDTYAGGISGVNLNHLNITNSISDGLSIIGGSGTLSGAVAANVNIPNYGLGTGGRHGMWARNDAIGSLTVSTSTIVEYRDDSPNFSFNFVSEPISVTVQANPPGPAFSVDGTNYTSVQSFTWTPGSSHTIATTTPQIVGGGNPQVWNSWSDAGAISHMVNPIGSTIYTANFSTNTQGHQIVLIDFGNNSSYRGVSVLNPDNHGHYWNSVWSGTSYGNLVDLGGMPTAVNLVFDSAPGTDYYNGPSGPTQDPNTVVINAAALGNLGVNNAVYDYYISSRFRLSGLDPAAFYTLTLYGSHKYNVDNVTRYSVCTDNSYSTVVASADLLVGVNAAHNPDTVATLSGLSPQTASTLFVKFAGTGGNSGYLNAMQLFVNHAPVAQPFTVTAPLGQSISVQVIGGTNAPTDADGDSLIISAVGSPVVGGGLTATNGGSGFTYKADGAAALGTNQFTYTVTDSYGATGTGTVTVVVFSPEGFNRLTPPTLVGNNAATISYLGISGYRYELNWATNLAAPIAWTSVATNPAGLDGIVNFTNASIAPVNFFRTRQVP